MRIGFMGSDHCPLVLGLKPEASGGGGGDGGGGGAVAARVAKVDARLWPFLTSFAGGSLPGATSARVDVALQADALRVILAACERNDFGASKLKVREHQVVSERSTPLH